jgi:HEAT repeat protein
MADLQQQLLTLAEQGTIEHRCAALLVLGALKLDNASVSKAVGAALQNPNPVIKDYALRYFESIQVKNGAAILIPLLEDSDKEFQERAVRLLSSAGQTAVQPLLHRAATATRQGQVNSARVLCALGGKSALKGLLQMLLGGSDELNKVICDLLTPVVREMEAKEQDSFFAEVEDFAGDLDVKQQRAAAVSAIRLLGLLGRPQARRWLFKHIAAEQAPIIRSHALVALLRCLREQDIHKDEYAKLFPLLEEAEFSESTRLALELLDGHELPDDARALLSKLMQSVHPEVQKFALRKMGEVGTPATVRTLIEQLGDADFRRRDVAASSLRKIPEARTALIKELLVCEDASKAWSIVELLPSFEGKWRQDAVDALWKRLQKAIDSEERIQAAFLHALKQADAEFVYAKLAEQGARLIKGKKYKEAAPFLTALKDFTGFKPEDKFRLALAQLKLHAHTVASHRQHPGVDLLIDLYRNSAYPLFETLRKEKTFTPEEFFALGFSLAERPGEERNLGKDLLEHVAEKSPRTKIGKNAKNKLKLLA